MNVIYIELCRNLVQHIRHKYVNFSLLRPSLWIFQNRNHENRQSRSARCTCTYISNKYCICVDIRHDRLIILTAFRISTYNFHYFSALKKLHTNVQDVHLITKYE